MTYIILYLVIGLIVAIAARIVWGKTQIELLVIYIIFWPFTLIELLGDLEI